MKRRILAGLLAVLMIFSLFGCMGLSEAAKAYNAAVEQLEAKGTVTLDIVQKTTTEIDGSTMTLNVTQVLTYDSANYARTAVYLTETFPDSTSQTPYAEYCRGTTLYVEYGNSFFSGSLTKDEVDKRYVPVGLLEAKRYRKVTKEAVSDGSVISFANAKSGEAWAIPTGAKLVEASGTAKLDSAGALQEMTYTAVYQYGPSKTTLEVISTPRQTAETFTVPTDTEKYRALDYVEGLRVVTYAQARMDILPNAAISLSALSPDYVATVDAYTAQKDGKWILSMDITAQHSGGISNDSMVYIDGTVYVPMGSDTLEEKRTEQEMRDTLKDATVTLTGPQYWENLTITDLGAVLLIEFTPNDDWDTYMERKMNIVSSVTEQDSYNICERTEYLAVNKYTGVMTAVGYNYTSTVTISGENITLSTQVAQSVEFPAPGAYKAITGEDPAEAEPESKPTPLFYKVTGKNGQTMWLFGTIHIGDERTAYLPKEIKDALASSDALALEMDTEKFRQDLENDPALQQTIRNAYNYTDGSSTADHLNESLYNTALKYMKASGNYTYSVDFLKVAIWENTISNFNLQLGCTLTSEKGVETRLTKWAHELNIPIREVESGPFQIDLLTGWSDELQEFLMRNTLSTDAQTVGQSTQQLYEQWCAGNEKTLRKSVGQSGKPNLLQKLFLKDYLPLLEEYNKGMNYDRNAGMLEVAKGYLESGDTVFFAVGLAHLLDSENGLVDALRDAGYTVELVKYA